MDSAYTAFTLGPIAFAQGLEVFDFHEVNLHAEAGERVVEEVVGAAVEVVGRDDLVARPRNVEEREGSRGLPARHGERPDATVELRDPLLEYVGRGVHEPGVDVAELLQREEARRVLSALELVRRRLEDRDRAGPCRRIGALASVQGDRLGARCSCGHGRPFGSQCPL